MKCFFAAAVKYLSRCAEILVVAGVQRVLATFVSTELQREERVLAPGHVGVHVDLVQALRKVREPLATDRSQVNLQIYQNKYI